MGPGRAASVALPLAFSDSLIARAGNRLFAAASFHKRSARPIVPIGRRSRHSGVILADCFHREAECPLYYVVGDSTKHMRDFDRIGVAVAHAAVLLNNIDPKNIDAEATAAIDTSGRWQRGGIYVTDAGTIRRRLCSVSRACMEP